MPPEFVLQFCIPQEYRCLIAELYYSGEHWAELNTEANELEVRFFPRTSGEPWSIPLQDALDALRGAELELKKRSIYFSNDSPGIENEGHG